MKFLHAMIRVKDLDKAMKFYKEILDMELVKTKRLDDCTLYFLSDKENTAQIELTHNDEIPENGYSNGNAFGHFAFEVESMDDFSERIKKAGVDYLWEPYKLNGKTKIAFVKDPDGNEIELIEKDEK